MRSRSRNANLRPPSQSGLWSETTIRGTNHRPPLPTGPYPWLLFCHHTYYKRRRQTFITLTAGHKTHGRAIPELCNKRVMGCFHGWLILSGKKTSDDHQRHYSLWNASTFETITLPPIKPELKFTVRSCLLSNPPGEPDSMVLLFDSDRPRILFFRTNRRDDNSNSKGWTLMQFNQRQFIDMKIWEEDNTDFDDYFAHSASCNGVIYVTTRGYSKLLKLDTDEKDGNKLVLKSLKTSLPYHGKHHSDRSRRYLVESEGELFLVRISLGGIMWNEVIAVGVYMFNLSRMDWLKVDRIADRVFFLGDSSSSCPASSESDKNCIYFVEEEDRYLYSYKVASGSLSVVFVFPELPGPKSFPTWFMPPTNEEESLQGEKKEHASVITERETEDSSKIINMLPLTQDNLVEIARYLSLLDYMNFRIVSREFLCAAPAIQWRKTSPATHSLSPWLIFIGKEDDRDVFTFIEPDLNGRYHTNIPDELHSADIRCSKDGWLLMSRNQDSVFFFNPFTKNVLPCPDLPPMGHITSFMFSSSPTSDECLIVGISYPIPGVIGICYVCRDKEEWEYTVLENKDFEPNQNSPVFLDGCFYFLGKKGDLFVLEFNDMTFGGELSVNIPTPCHSFHQNFLVESDKELLSIFVGIVGKWVRVFRLDRAAKLWKEIHTLGNQTVYISRSSAFSVVAKSHGMENRIYFPRLYNESMVCYCLDAQKFQYSGGADHSLKDYANTADQLLCGWIEPRWV